ncbi:transcriptional regulator [Microbulbifer agarilyticus]|uniref:Transcriptional regulator n=1 Tax=Microbulbifer agarilyticus TaxID=260552 RepID=A0A1Q2M488_9GAMM|nr:helix-turn-helix transcriptional regulator [Microbulbifer agarilyticus]AQQ67469.1 transcriptional regulator [Microbulbifer agarilyticus]
MHSNTTPNFRPLAPRQAEALTHRAQGLTQAETAAAMGCSPANVANLLGECFFKLHARSSVDAVAKAVQHGLIHLALVATIFAGMGPNAGEQMRTRFQRRPTIRTIRIRNNREDLA